MQRNFTDFRMTKMAIFYGTCAKVETISAREGKSIFPSFFQRKTLLSSLQCLCFAINKKYRFHDTREPMTFLGRFSCIA